MTYLLGTDEAGYGPNLGPLVIAATAWRVPDRLQGQDLYRSLAPAIVAEVADAGEQSTVAIADSKKLYKPGSGLARLECGVLAALAALEWSPRTWREIFLALAPQSESHWSTQPWLDDYDCPLPIDARADAIDRSGNLLTQALAGAGIQLSAVRAAVIFPSEFNSLVDAWGNKAELLSLRTLGLVAEIFSTLPDEPVYVLCDKHGGRNRYAALLQAVFPDHLIQVRDEGRQASRYRFAPSRRQVDFCFQARGEGFLPSALASMTAKYLRELSMRPWNEFWCGRIAGLRPTAGYPQDARRFKQAIEPTQRRLGIDDRLVWRSR